MSHHQMHPQQMAGKRLPAPPGPGPSGPLGTTLAPPQQSSSSSNTNAGGGPLHGASVVRPSPPETALTRRLTDLLLLAPISLNLAEMTAADWRLIARLENETQLEQAARVHRCTVSCRGENLVALHCVQWNSMRCSFRLLYVRNKGDLFSQGQHNHAQTAPLWELPMMPTTTRLPRPRFIAQTQTQALHGTSVVRPPPPEALTAQTQPILPSQSVPVAMAISNNEPSSTNNANDQQPKRKRNRKLGPEWRLVRQLTNDSELRQLGFQPNGRRKKQYVDCPWGVPCQARLCLQKDLLTLYESGQHSHIRQPAASNEEGGGPSGGAPSSSAGGSIAASRPAEAQMAEAQSSEDHQQHKSRKRRADGKMTKISDEQRPKQQPPPLKMIISLGVNADVDDNAASTTTPVGTTTTTPQASSSCSSANGDNNSIIRNFLNISTNSSNGMGRGDAGNTVTVASSHFSARTTTSTTSSCIVHNGQCRSNSNNQDIAVTNILGQLAPTPPLFNLLLAGGQLPVADTTAVASSPSCSSSSDASTAANFFEPLTPENSVVDHHQKRMTESVQTQTSDGASTTAASATTTPRLVTPFVPEIVIISSDDDEEEEEQPQGQQEKMQMEKVVKGKESQGQQQSEQIGREETSQVPAASRVQAMGGGEHPAVGGNQTGQQITASEPVMLTGLGRGGEEAAAVNIAHEEPQNAGGATSQHQQQQQQVEGVVSEAAENGVQKQQGGVIVRNIVVASREQQSSSTAANAAALFAACSSSNVPTGRGELTNIANSNLARADQAVQAGHVEQQPQHQFHLFNLAELFRQVCWRFQMQFRVEGAKFVIKRVDPDQRIGDLLLFEDRGPLIVVTEYRERHSLQPDGRQLGQWVQQQSRWIKSDIEQFMTAVRGRCDQMLTSQPHLEP